MQKQVLVKWIVKGVADGKMRFPGDEDVLLQKKAKFLPKWMMKKLPK